MRNQVTTCDLCPPYTSSAPVIHLALHVCALCAVDVCVNHHRSISLHLAGAGGSQGLFRHVLSLCVPCATIIDHDLIYKSNTVADEITNVLAISLLALRTEIALAKNTEVLLAAKAAK